MAHFAYVRDGIVRNVERIESVVMLDEQGNEVEQMGKEFLAATHPGTSPDDFVQTSITGSMRGTYAGIGWTYDPVADIFIAPDLPPSTIDPPTGEA